MCGLPHGTQTQYLHKTTPLDWSDCTDPHSAPHCEHKLTVITTANHPIDMYRSRGQLIVCSIYLFQEWELHVAKRSRQLAGDGPTWPEWVLDTAPTCAPLKHFAAPAVAECSLYLSHLSNQSGNLVSEIQSVGHENQLAWPWPFTKSRETSMTSTEKRPHGVGSHQHPRMKGEWGWGRIWDSLNN